MNGSELDRLAELVARLRRECPWDREQTPETLRTFLLEECYEALAALDSGDPAALREELGDLLFQIFFLAEIAEERGWFALGEVADGIARKMISRHPHVFSGAGDTTAQEVRRGWEARKRRESGAADPLGSLPQALPALSAALRMTARAADLGFDWERDSDVAAKIEEELDEWREAARDGDAAGEEREVGDLLLSVVNLARRRGVDPEVALRKTGSRFRSRFAGVCARVAASGKEIGQVPLEDLDRYWEEAKDDEKGSDEKGSGLES